MRGVYTQAKTRQIGGGEEGVVPVIDGEGAEAKVRDWRRGGQSMRSQVKLWGISALRGEDWTFAWRHVAGD